MNHSEIITCFLLGLARDQVGEICKCVFTFIRDLHVYNTFSKPSCFLLAQVTLGNSIDFNVPSPTTGDNRHNYIHIIIEVK